MNILPRLLIAEGSEELQNALASTFSERYQIRTCGDGNRAKALLESFQPDVFLVDLALPATDGITLLRGLPEENRPILVAILPFASSYMQNALQQLQVDYLFLKPLNIPAVLDRVQELTAHLMPETEECDDSQERLYYALRDAGVAARSNGFSCLLEAMPRFMEDPEQALTKELYPEVGTKFQKSGLAVERSIRSAIEGAWQRGGYKNWGYLFPTDAAGRVAKPSNKEFLCALAAYLQIEANRRKRAR